MANITVQIASKNETVPAPRQIEHWANQALKLQFTQGELCIRVVDNEESATLNAQYRKKSGPTNVLSFLGEGPLLLGDIVICAPLMEQEAKQRGSSVEAHWAHIVIHGVLHLLGYDHVTDADASAMEAAEIELLKDLGYDNPHRDSPDNE